MFVGRRVTCVDVKLKGMCWCLWADGEEGPGVDRRWWHAGQPSVGVCCGESKERELCCAHQARWHILILTREKLWEHWDSAGCPLDMWLVLWDIGSIIYSVVVILMFLMSILETMQWLQIDFFKNEGSYELCYFYTWCLILSDNCRVQRNTWIFLLVQFSTYPYCPWYFSMYLASVLTPRSYIDA